MISGLTRLLIHMSKEETKREKKKKREKRQGEAGADAANKKPSTSMYGSDKREIPKTAALAVAMTSPSVCVKVCPFLAHFYSSLNIRLFGKALARFIMLLGPRRRLVGSAGPLVTIFGVCANAFGEEIDGQGKERKRNQPPIGCFASCVVQGEKACIGRKIAKTSKKERCLCTMPTCSKPMATKSKSEHNPSSPNTDWRTGT